MTWILNGDLANPIEDSAPFVGSDGTHYPWNWDKSTVPGMVKVTETDRPDDALNVVTGSSFQLVAGVPTRVWASTPRTAQDLKDRANAPIVREIAALEQGTFRALRDCARGNGNTPDGTGKTPKQRLDDVETQITALRGGLQ